MSRVLLGIILILFLGCVVGGVVIKIQYDHVASLKKDNTSLQTKYDAAVNQVEFLNNVRSIDESVSAGVQQAQVENNQKVKEIIKEVDITTQKVKTNEITSSDADNAYSHSMWDAYCQATRDSSSCPSR